MASSWTHAVGAVAVASVLVPGRLPSRAWLAIAVGAAALDVDAVGRLWGGGDVAWLGGHRGLTHSVPFAAALGALLSLMLWRSVSGARSRVVLWFALTLAIASHGLLDSLTAYGEGIQFLAPFAQTRYRAPWPLLGDGIVRDTIAFIAFYGIARAVTIRRGLPVPGILNASFFRATV